MIKRKIDPQPMPYLGLQKVLFRQTVDQRIETLGRRYNLFVSNRDFIWLRPTLSETLLARKLEAVEKENN